MSLSSGKPCQMSGSHYQIFGSDRESLPDVWKWSEDPRGCPEVVWRPSRMLEWSGRPPGCPGVVGRPSWMSLSSGRPCWMSGSCREASGCPGVPPCCPGVIERSSRMSGSS